MEYFMKILNSFQANNSNLKLKNASDNMNKNILRLFLVYLSMYIVPTENDTIYRKILLKYQNLSKN